jgi:hypothetical protein
MPETANPSELALYSIEAGAETVKDGDAIAGIPVENRLKRVTINVAILFMETSSARALNTLQFYPFPTLSPLPKRG